MISVDTVSASLCKIAHMLCSRDGDSSAHEVRHLLVNLFLSYMDLLYTSTCHISTTRLLPLWEVGAFHIPRSATASSNLSQLSIGTRSSQLKYDLHPAKVL